MGTWATLQDSKLNGSTLSKWMLAAQQQQQKFPFLVRTLSNKKN